MAGGSAEAACRAHDSAASAPEVGALTPSFTGGRASAGDDDGDDSDSEGETGSSSGSSDSEEKLGEVATTLPSPVSSAHKQRLPNDERAAKSGGSGGGDGHDGGGGGEGSGGTQVAGRRSKGRTKSSIDYCGNCASGRCVRQVSVARCLRHCAQGHPERARCAK